MLLKYNIIGGFLSEAFPAPVHTITLSKLLNPLCFSAEHVDANHDGRALIRWGRIHVYIYINVYFFYVIEGPYESRKMVPCRNPINIFCAFRRNDRN